MVRSKSKSPPLPYFSHTPRELSPRPESAFEDFTLFDAPETRPSSGVFASNFSSPRSDMGARPPSLSEILLDNASPPWSLAAFTAYLSNNHCLETLEFTLDLQRYSAYFDQVYTGDAPDPQEVEFVATFWDRIIAVYIMPCSAREINIPSRVRDQLLSLSSRPQPPHPSALEEAGRIIYELMNDSVLLPFLESVNPMHLDETSHHDSHSSKYAPYFGLGRGRTSPRTQSRTRFSNELEGLTDDSESGSPAATEPMTPPTTPPTSTEWGFGNSPGGLQRAMAAQKEGWKKMGAKLGFNRRSSSKRSPPTSSVPGYEVNRHGSMM